jgi:hypothetical protein
MYAGFVFWKGRHTMKHIISFLEGVGGDLEELFAAVKLLFFSSIA